MCIEKLECHDISWRLQHVVDQCSRRRILSCGFLRRKWCAHERIRVDADRRGRVKQPCSARLLSLSRLSKGGDVVENPERSAVCRDDQIVSMDCEIAH